MEDITKLAARFNVATEALEAATAKLRELDVDTAIAERAKQPVDGIAENRKAVLRNDWTPAHAEQKAAAMALCDALGVVPLRLRIALA